MVGKKIVALGIVAMALAVAGCQEKKELTQIGINQFVVHEALDASRQGFLDVLKENGYVEGEDIEIGFNAKFLVEMLNNLGCKEVSLRFSAPNRAGLILPGEQDANEDILMLVMPVMLNNYV